MIKYYPESLTVVFEEVPDYVSLAVEITNCPGTCEGCHSPWLREDIGEELTPETLYELIEKNKGINCVVFMGEGKDPEALKKLALGVRTKYSDIKVALYSGRNSVEDEYNNYFDYIKIGPYRGEFGPLNKETTNQRLYEIVRGFGTDFEVTTGRKDITYKFWKKN